MPRLADRCPAGGLAAGEEVLPGGGAQGALSITLGQASITGRREQNEDFYGCFTPSDALLRTKGICAVVADGVGGSLGGMEAAQTSVRSLLTDYYSTPETWSVTKSVSRVLAATNSWVHAEGRKNPRLAGMATTLTALVLKGSHYFVCHVGDSRVYLLRDGLLRQLSSDHVHPMPGDPDILTRAIGLDTHLRLELHSGELHPGDRFLMVTDGVTGALDDDRLMQILSAGTASRTICDRMVQAAYEAGSTDNITAQMVSVLSVPDAASEALAATATTLSAAPRLDPGTVIDEFRIERQLHSGRASRVYLATDLRRDIEDGRPVILKFLPRSAADDPVAVERFLREGWTGGRIRSNHVIRTLPLSRGRRSALYYAMEYVAGEPLSGLLARHGDAMTPERVVEIGCQLARALSDLHRLGVVHRDVKPENVRITPEGRVVLLDLGTARVEGLGEGAAARPEGPPGTPSYMAPELFQGEPGNETSDIYALGVTLYHLLSRRYPYGEVEPFSRPSFTTPTALRQHNPEVPKWLEWVIGRATAKEPSKRYAKMTALLHALEHPDAVVVEFQPLLERNPVRFWKWACLGMTGLCAVLLSLLARSG